MIIGTMPTDLQAIPAMPVTRLRGLAALGERMAKSPGYYDLQLSDQDVEVSSRYIP
jgi:hypothetical protein